MKRLGLLLCGHVHPDALDIGGDYPALFGGLFVSHHVEIVPYAVEDGRLPESVDECDGWITSPSRASVLDTHPWVADLSAFVVEAVTRERPFIGICFGHQLIAQLFGGRVERAGVGWGVGVKDYEIVERRPWMMPPARSIALVASHEDQVMEMPPGATLLARSPYCPIAAFELGSRCVTLQPHIEFTPAISRRLTELRRELIGGETADRALASLDRETDRDLVAHWFSQFLGA
ncbi:MAG: hypothetical protein U0Q22_10300 [Acidimicrobiales bacterium]